MRLENEISSVSAGALAVKATYGKAVGVDSKHGFIIEAKGSGKWALTSIYR